MNPNEVLRTIQKDAKIGVDFNNKQKRIVVGMATCGIAAGAKPVFATFADEAVKRNLTNVLVTQTGCIGACRLEPMCDVLIPGEERITYVKLTPERARRIMSEHIVNGHIVAEYTVGYHEAHNI